MHLQIIAPMRKLRKILYVLIAAISIAVLFGTRRYYYNSGYHLENYAPVLGSMWGDVVIFGLFWITLVLFLWSLMKGTIRDKAATALLLIPVGFTFSRSAPIDYKAFLEGIRDRLAVDIDPKQLQDWAAGMLPNTPPKEGSPIHLPNGQTITPERIPNSSSSIGEDGSFYLSPANLPPQNEGAFPIHANVQGVL
jgi:hypothetical protein